MSYPPPIGSKLRTGFRNHCDELLHVRGLVDGRIVLRVWLKHKGRWSYRVENETWWTHFFLASNGTVEAGR